MPFLGEKERAYVSKLFESLKEDVEMVVFTQEFECEYCKATRELAEEVASLSSKLRVRVYDFLKDADRAKEMDVDKIPALLIRNPNRAFSLRFFGIPSGYEFVSLIEGLVDASKGETRLSPETKQKVRSYDKDVHIQVFVTPTCPYCPRAVRTAHQMAMENPKIKADMVESMEFPQLANRYEVMAVPKIVVNGRSAFEGALPERQFVQSVFAAAEGAEDAPYS